MTFLNGETAVLTLSIVDPDTKQRTDPDAVTITITRVSSDTPIVDNQNATKTGVGEYKYEYMTTSIGDFKVLWKLTKGNNTAFEDDFFTVR
jgi:hypothetical protein